MTDLTIESGAAYVERYYAAGDCGVDPGSLEVHFIRTDGDGANRALLFNAAFTSDGRRFTQCWDVWIEGGQLYGEC